MVEVLVTKIKSLNPSDGSLIPVGYKVSGFLVDLSGIPINVEDLKSKGLQIRVSGTKFSEKPFQFAADKVQLVKKINKDYQVFTISSVYFLEFI